MVKSKLLSHNLQLVIGFLLLSFVVLSCKIKSHTPMTYDKKMITLGNGGGFTGAVTSYYLMEDGTVFRSGMSDTSYIKVGTLDKNTIGQQFSNYDNLSINDLNLNDPGNRYFFIIMKDENGKEHKVQWGRSELEDARLQVYHKNIMHLIKKLENTREEQK